MTHSKRVLFGGLAAGRVMSWMLVAIVIAVSACVGRRSTEVATTRLPQTSLRIDRVGCDLLGLPAGECLELTRGGPVEVSAPTAALVDQRFDELRVVRSATVDSRHVQGAALSAVFELPGPLGRELAAAWSMSAPPTGMAGSVRVAGDDFDVSLRFETGSAADARALQRNLDLLREPGALTLLALGDFSPLFRRIELRLQGNVLTATAAIPKTTWAALVQRAPYVRFGVMTEGEDVPKVYLHPDEFLSSGASYAPPHRRKEYLSRVAEDFSAVHLGYPEGTSHGRLTRVVTDIEEVGLRAMVAAAPGPVDEAPLVRFDAQVAQEAREELTANLEACRSARAAEPCFALAEMLRANELPVVKVRTTCLSTPGVVDAPKHFPKAGSSARIAARIASWSMLRRTQAPLSPSSHALE